MYLSPCNGSNTVLIPCPLACTTMGQLAIFYFRLQLHKLFWKIVFTHLTDLYSPSIFFHSVFFLTNLFLTRVKSIQPCKLYIYNTVITLQGPFCVSQCTELLLVIVCMLMQCPSLMNRREVNPLHGRQLGFFLQMFWLLGLHCAYTGSDFCKIETFISIPKRRQNRTIRTVPCCSLTCTVTYSQLGANVGQGGLARSQHFQFI